MLSYSELKNGIIKYEVGLNNQYRVTDFKNKSYAAIGEWTDANTFTIHYEVVGYSSKGKWVLKFNNNKIEVTETGMTGTYSYHGELIEN